MSRGTFSRRRKFILAALVAVHLAAFWIYAVQERQAKYLAQVLDAREQWRNGHLDAAADLYRGFASDYPDFAWPLVLYRSYPTQARAWYSLGRVEAERGHVDAALDAYRRAMLAEPGLGQREFRNLLLTEGRYAQLESAARARLERDPGDLAGWWDLGAAEFGLDQPAAAAGAYAEALKRLPDWLNRHLRHGAGSGLSAEEGDLRGLLSVASLEAGLRAQALEQCAELGRRERREEHYDQLCRGYLALADGDAERAALAVKDYQPGAPEHERLVSRLNERIAALAAKH